MPFKFDNINYLAVVTAGLATFFLGAVWYTALFGKMWVQLTGYSDEKLKQLQAKRPPPLFFGGMIVCYLVMSFASSCGLVLRRLSASQAIWQVIGISGFT
jgi:hypothetical protein